MTAVGDPFQAIYGWRGAAASNIITFAEDFRRADGRPARRFALTVNRRSGQTILDVANVLSRPLRPDADARSPDGLHDRTAERARAAAGTGRQRRRAGPGGDLRHLAGGGRLDRRPDRRRSGDGTVPHWADIAVLTRRNADIAPALRRADRLATCRSRSSASAACCSCPRSWT